MTSPPRRQDGSPKRVLLAWEYGAGRTHYGNLLAVARHLREAGVECLATLYDLSNADREFAAIGVRTIQAFVWPGQKRTRIPLPVARADSFTDLLANLGFGAAEALASCIAHYDGLFSLFRPDLILADHAYGAVLAGRDHVPVIAMASATQLPPVVGDGFPPLPGRDGPGYPVDVLLRSINAGLGRAGRFPLRDMADLLRSVITVPLGPAEFDIYAAERKSPVLPPLVPGVPSPDSITEGTEVFAYLHNEAQADAALMSTLAGLDLPLRIYLPGMSGATRQRLANCIIHDEPVPVAEVVARSRCVVHHGGPQLSAVCIATGLPQVILSRHLDNRLSVAFVEARGLGEGRELGDASSDWLGKAIHRGWADADLRKRCKAAAPGYHARWFAQDTAAILADYVRARILSPGPGATGTR